MRRRTATRCPLLLTLAMTVAGPVHVDASTEVKPLPAIAGVMGLTPPRSVADFAMTNHEGKPARLADFKGAPALVFFGFTHCPDACPTTLQKLAQIKRAQAKDLAGVRVVLVSVDGERDTPEVMNAFLKRFSGEFVGLTAPAAEVRNLALSFAAPFFKDPPTDGGYQVQHSPRVYALDKQGRLRAELYEASTDAVTAVAKSLLAE